VGARRNSHGQLSLSPLAAEFKLWKIWTLKEKL